MRDGRGCGRLPEWWSAADPDDRMRAYDRAKKVIHGGYVAVD